MPLRIDRSSSCVFGVTGDPLVGLIEITEGVADEIEVRTLIGVEEDGMLRDKDVC